MFSFLVLVSFLGVVRAITMIFKKRTLDQRTAEKFKAFLEEYPEKD